jgi:predicted GIY-YIG superfamily endonuclease
MEYIYILKCQKEKYYIGKTYNVQIEYNEHLDGSFCNFTKEFKPCDIDGIFEVDKNISNLELVIAKYVNKYDKKSISFKETDIKLIKKILKTINNKCICDSESHWLDSCKLNLKDEFWSKMFNKMLNNFTKNCRESNICCRCGRFGHFLDQCYAKKHNDGYNLSDEIDENEIDFIQ